jgi:hypothetical protein
MQGDFTRDRKAGGDTMVVGGYAEGTYSPVRCCSRAARASISGRRPMRTALSGQHATIAITLDSSRPDASGTVPSVRAGAKYDLNHRSISVARVTRVSASRRLNELHRSFRVGNDITQANPLLEARTFVRRGSGARWPRTTAASAGKAISSTTC